MNRSGLSVAVNGLRKVYAAADGTPVTAVSRLSFQIEPGEQVSLVGRTGCGKSTLFRLLAGLEAPTGGSVRIAGRDPMGDSDWFRGRLAMVFQEDRLLPWRTALANATLGLEILKVERNRRERLAREWLQRLGLEEFTGAYPGQLSGGMRQRVALARAFVLEPQLILADEAFGHLDEVTGGRLRSQFFELARLQGTTVLLVTHNLSEAVESAERILVLGQPGVLLADIDLRHEKTTQSPETLRRRVQTILERNQVALPAEKDQTEAGA